MSLHDVNTEFMPSESYVAIHEDDLMHILHVYKAQMTADIELQDKLIADAAKYPGSTTQPMERLKAQFQAQRAWANKQLAICEGE